ncbi:MAG: beta-lactamase family protein, partial [Clostridiales bacterium]|nr:beta-lactamase family protein [Clostridiales bacterium]
MNKRILILVTACLMLCLPDYLEVAAVGDVSKEMEQYVESMVEEANLPGVLVTVVKDGEEPVFIKKGYQNVKNEEPVTEDTRFEMGSNSKAFTGLGLWYLVEQGKISLDDPVKKYLPWFRLRYQGEEQEVLVKDLLYQTTGVSSSTIGLIQPDKSEDALLCAVKELVKHETVSKAGESFLYATINYDCVGLLIETVTGESYEKFINETLLPRYGLKNTYAGKKEAGEDKFVATGYKTGLFGNIEYHAPIYRGNTPAGYVVTDGNDLAKWLKLQLEAAMKKDT